jgi:hypothetical protein
MMLAKNAKSMVYEVSLKMLKLVDTIKVKRELLVVSNLLKRFLVNTFLSPMEEEGCYLLKKGPLCRGKRFTALPYTTPSPRRTRSF